MYLSKTDIENTPRVKRLNIINSISGIKPGNLIGTKSNDGFTNLAIFSSVVHIGSNPAYLGFIQRPVNEVRRHTYENIIENGFFTINHIHDDFIDKAHLTSLKLEKEKSEFLESGLSEEYLYSFFAPFVKESHLKIGLKYVEQVRIKSNNTILVVGEVQHLIIPDHVIDSSGYIDLGKLGDVGISGLNSYYKLKKVNEFPYVRIRKQ